MMPNDTSELMKQIITEMKEMKNEMSSMKHEMSSIKNEITTIKGDIKDIRGDIKEIRCYMEGQYLALTARISHLENMGTIESVSNV